MARYTPLVSSIPSPYCLRILVILLVPALIISLYSLSYVRPESRISADSLSFWKTPKVKYPFCQRCSGPQNDPICEEYGDDALKRSLAHEGTSRRLKEKILKAQEGQPIKFAVLGGSANISIILHHRPTPVSAGHGLEDRSEVYHQRIFNWWNTQYPDDRNEIVQGAVPATDSAYYAYCYENHIPTDVDIIFIEFALNDGSTFPSERNNGDPLASKMMESLVRNLLRLPSKPAIVFISFFSFNVNEYFDGQESHLPVANYYDVTFISLKNVLYDFINRNPEALKPQFYYDGHHPTGRGHRIAADLFIHHIQQQICTLSRPTSHVTHGHDSFSLNESLPLVDMWTKRPQHASFRELNPTCHTFIDQGYRPKAMDGWKLWNWQGEKFYVVANETGATVTFEITANQGVVYLYVLKSKSYSLGDVWCWADTDKEHGVKITGYWTLIYSVGVMVPTVEGLSPGEHDIRCEVLPSEKSQNPNGGTNFRILAIMSG
ncbi:hypothetical protein BC937DRAFT_88412 [Endogone sp. FLAS-F59071]|nr:hypothetical protein BC937DRAFT_88412 [Endogone sp. FLAS-F59071]|eukprot:RUS18728.1 hypothetical protein BC937DRAFT_88412 [Endogone sp. FLAS-F59071]